MRRANGLLHYIFYNMCLQFFYFLCRIMSQIKSIAKYTINIFVLLFRENIDSISLYQQKLMK